MNQARIGALVVAVITFIVGYAIGDHRARRGIPDEEVTASGPFMVDTATVVAATLQSLQAETKLVSYTFTTTASVSLTRSLWRIFEGRQQLTVPVTVRYYVDLSQLSERDVRYDPATNTVLVRLPKLMFTVSFHPERAIEINTGSLTVSDETVQELRQLNYKTAREAVRQQVRQPEFVRLAKEQTIRNVESLFSIPLRTVGKDDVSVTAEFPATR
jgi:hypothetical protein